MDEFMGCMACKENGPIAALKIRQKRSQAPIGYLYMAPENA